MVNRTHSISSLFISLQLESEHARRDEDKDTTPPSSIFLTSFKKYAHVTSLLRNYIITSVIHFLKIILNVDIS